ncbi:hypothetical protein CYMTET_40976 [Cymbomonas tetramitiformis]|uniref:Uncharacterized protein n=1 Tax=Cymbomonas tetramitiformis TaxID=36881 RepID=A0AAE0C835_9CHLO|nr:hypothetical protein CYMTET_40976 [Cymbomonas tetramitiformis]
MSRREDCDDPLGLMGKSSIAGVLRAARASLKEPSRPITPMDRKLFSVNEYAKRPESSYLQPTSKVFLEAINTTRPSGNLPKLEPISDLASPMVPDKEVAPRSPTVKRPASPRSRRGSGSGRSSLSLRDSNSGELRESNGVNSGKEKDSLKPRKTHSRSGAGDAEARGVSQNVPTCEEQNRGSAHEDAPRRSKSGKSLGATLREAREASKRGEAPTEAATVEESKKDSKSGRKKAVRDATEKANGKGAEKVTSESFDVESCKYTVHKDACPPPEVAEAELGSLPPLEASEPPEFSPTDQDLEYGEAIRESTSRDSLRSSKGTFKKMKQRKDEEAVQDARLAGTLHVLDEMHEAWCGDVEETLDQMSEALSMSKREGNNAEHPVLTELMDRLGVLIERGSKEMEWLRWLATPAAGSMTGVSPRESMLHQLFRIMDSPSVVLLMKSCILTIKVAEDSSTFKNTFKVLFRLSKDAKNDSLFRRERLLPLLVHFLEETDKKMTLDVLVYVAGTLKNISSDSSNQKSLVKGGVLPVMMDLLQRRCSHQSALSAGTDSAPGTARPKSATGRPPSTRSANGTDDVAQLAVQVTGILRNLAVYAGHAEQFMKADAIAALTSTIGRFVRHEELMLNVTRILSKLSMDDDCRREMGKDEEHLRQLLQLLKVQPDNSSLVLRVAFILGNLTVSNSRNRVELGLNLGGVDLFVTLIGRYCWKKDNPSTNSTSSPPPTAGTASRNDAAVSGETGGSDRVEKSKQASTSGKKESTSSKKDKGETDEAVLVKLIRVLANMSIHPEVGSLVSKSEMAASALLALLKRYKLEESEELVLNVVGAITNLSFYESEENQMLALRSEVPRSMISILMCDNEEAVVEAARAFGNFSRHREVRDYMAASRVDEVMCLLLDHGNRDVLYSICGVIMNLTSDVQHWQLLAEAEGISKMIDTLDRCLAEGDLPLATLISKALFNMCARKESEEEQEAACFNAEEVHALVTVLMKASTMVPSDNMSDADVRGDKSAEDLARAEEAAEMADFNELGKRLMGAVKNVATYEVEYEVEYGEEDGEEHSSGDLEPLYRMGYWHLVVNGDGHWSALDDGMWLSLWYPSDGYCLFEDVGDSSAAGSIHIQCLGVFSPAGGLVIGSHVTGYWHRVVNGDGHWTVLWMSGCGCPCGTLLTVLMVITHAGGLVFFDPDMRYWRIAVNGDGRRVHVGFGGWLSLWCYSGGHCLLESSVDSSAFAARRGRRW